MKKLIIAAVLIITSATVNASAVKNPQITVHSQNRTIRLSMAQISLLKHYGMVKEVIENYKTGGTISNNEAADNIFVILAANKSVK